MGYFMSYDKVESTRCKVGNFFFYLPEAEHGKMITSSVRPWKFSICCISFEKRDRNVHSQFCLYNILYYEPFGSSFPNRGDSQTHHPYFYNWWLMTFDAENGELLFPPHSIILRISRWVSIFGKKIQSTLDWNPSRRETYGYIYGLAPSTLWTLLVLIPTRQTAKQSNYYT